MDAREDISKRYDRQVIYAPLGLDGQKSLTAGRALIVGVGGLGSWTAELLARAGVGTMTLIDDDRVDWTNLHRQAMYDESDARRRRAKVTAAGQRLAQINSAVEVETIEGRLAVDNAIELADRADVIIDGTDNFATRFLINDVSVRTGVPWVFAGVVGAEAQTMTVVPGRSACLRCVFHEPPPPCVDPTCRSAGVLGPAVAAVAAIQASEAVKILAGKVDTVSRGLRKIDLWTNTFQRIDASQPQADCTCCGRGEMEYLEP